MRAGRGVLGRWVVRKVVSQVGEGLRCLVVVSWREICVDRFGCVIMVSVGDITALWWHLVHGSERREDYVKYRAKRFSRAHAYDIR